MPSEKDSWRYTAPHRPASRFYTTGGVVFERQDRIINGHYEYRCDVNHHRYRVVRGEYWEPISNSHVEHLSDGWLAIDSYGTRYAQASSLWRLGKLLCDRERG